MPDQLDNKMLCKKTLKPKVFFFFFPPQVQWSLLMVFKTEGLPKPLPFFSGSGMETERKSSVLGAELEQGLRSSWGPVSSHVFASVAGTDGNDIHFVRVEEDIRGD